MDAKSWMKDLKGHQLRHLVLPGAHDCGTYALSNKLAPKNELPPIIINLLNPPLWLILLLPPWLSGLWNLLNGAIFNLIRAIATAQSHNVKSQLDQGIRALDVRPCVDGSSLLVQHALEGPAIETILGDVVEFLKQPEAQSELVFIYIGELGFFEQDDHTKLIKLIEDRLGDYLQPASASTDNKLDLDVTLGELVTGGPKVIVFYDSPSELCNTKFYDYQHCGSYANTASLSAMKPDQTKKLCDCQNYATLQTHLMWLLTPQPDDIRDLVVNEVVDLPGSDDYVFGPWALKQLLRYLGVSDLSPAQPSYSSLHQLSRQANPSLGGFLDACASGKLTPNVIWVDFFEDTEVVQNAIDLSRKYPDNR